MLFDKKVQQFNSSCLISLSVNIRIKQDGRNINCGTFFDLQKAFDTLENYILLLKPEYYGIRGLVIEFLKSFLSDKKKKVSINGYNSSLATVKSNVPQGLVPGLLLFSIYINYSNQPMNYCKVHHFADDTNLPHFSKSVNKLNKYINIDLKNLA